MTTSIHIIGDSTAAKKLPEARPESGWGEFLHLYLPEKYEVQNHAVNGRSTKSFIDEGRFEIVADALTAGDYLFIQFGHNDQKVEDPERFTEPFGSYQENISQFIATAQEKDAIPIVLTSVSRRTFQDGMLDPLTLGDYPLAAMALADELDVQFIDVFGQSQDLLQTLGEEKSKELFLHLSEGEHTNYPEGVLDDTHFNESGAKTIANLIAKEFSMLITN